MHARIIVLIELYLSNITVRPRPSHLNSYFVFSAQIAHTNYMYDVFEHDVFKKVGCYQRVPYTTMVLPLTVTKP